MKVCPELKVHVDMALRLLKTKLSHMINNAAGIAQSV
jgi:hypothetical protein